MSHSSPHFGPKLLFFVTEDYYFVSHRLPMASAAKADGYDVCVVTRVRDWPHSSFHLYVRRGLLPQDWAGDVNEGASGYGEPWA